MTSSSTHHICVVDAPHVAQAFKEAGFSVIAGATFLETGKALGQALNEGLVVGLVVADGDNVRVPKWLQAQKRVLGVAVLESEVPGVLADHEALMSLPVTVNDVLAAVGVPAVVGGGRFVINSDHSYTVVNVPAEPVAVDVVDEDEAEFEALMLLEAQAAQSAPEEVSAPVVVVDDVAPVVSELPAWFKAPGGPSPVVVVEEFENEAAEPDIGAVVDEFVPPVLEVSEELFIPDVIENVVTTHVTPVFEDDTEELVLPRGNFTPPPITEPFHTAPHLGEPDIFEQDAYRLDNARISRTGKAPVIVSWAAKGGVGKTTNALNLGELAGQRGLNVTIVDANRGQPDFHKDLRIGNDPLPTMYDYATGTIGLQSLIITAEELNKLSRSTIAAVNFNIILGPPNKGIYAERVTARHYSEAIEYARQNSDLVIVDTQILESVRTDLWSELFTPLFRSGAWGLGIVDNTRAGVENLTERLNEFTAEGVAGGTQMVIATKYPNFGESHAGYFAQELAGTASFIGSIGFDPTIVTNKNMGVIDPNLPVSVTVLSAALFRVTNLPIFSPHNQQKELVKKSLFGKLRKR